VTDNKDINGSATQSVHSLETEGSEVSLGKFEHRRRILKGAAVVTPLMMTVASRPVLGAQCTPSAWVSGNLSDHGKDRLSCGGYSPGYWKTNPHRWQGTGFSPGTCGGGDYTQRHWKYSTKHSWHGGTCKTYDSDGTPFHQTFRSRQRGVFPGRYYGNKTLMQVMWLQGNEDPYQLGAHMVAALLNAASNRNYGMTVRQVIDMYGQLARRGYFRPSVGDPMSPQEVVLFIQNTFS